ncbi:hypothetical protein IV203_016763 [Nitzschia inconspicua]|uniref:Uncharacterized protein n=1 Tax=Nitzschia inconspicua TaxID=303405 RepID=A0A9K3PHZ2_9STRA|nr:hypothetical protein IV203_016763 [Nitzschia inconspicua]
MPKTSTSAPRTDAIEFVGKSTLHKELQRTIAVVCWDEVSTVIKSSGLSKEDQQDMAYKLYHGDIDMPDSMGYSEQLFKAHGMWKCLFMEDIPDPWRNYPGLIMKRRYHRQEKEIKVHPDEAEAQINLALLNATFLKNRQMVSGRAIIDGGKMVMANVRIMLGILQHSIYQPYLASGSHLSGLEWDDYLEFLLDSFWKHQQTATATSEKEKADMDGDSAKKKEAAAAKKAPPAAAAKKKKTPPAQKKAKQSPKNSNAEEEESDDEEEEDVVAEEVKQRPKNWLWTGFIAFAIFGPILPADQDKKHQLKIFFTLDGGKDDQRSKGGSSSVRKKNQEDDNKKRKVAPMSHRDHMTEQQTNMMRAVVAQQVANMHYQRNVGAAHQEIEIAHNICKTASVRNKEQEEGNKKRKVVPISHRDHVTELQINMMRAGIAQQVANMHYQRNVGAARQKIEIAQFMYKTAMDEYGFWRGQLDTDQLKHPELDREDHAVCMYLEAMEEMKERKAKLNCLMNNVQASYSIDPKYQGIIDDTLTQSFTMQHIMTASVATTSQVPVCHVTVSKPIATGEEDNDDDDELRLDSRSEANKLFYHAVD